MKTSHHLLALVASAFAWLLVAGCAQDARTARVERRQDRIDARTSARQERWQIRSDRADARADARFNSW